MNTRHAAVNLSQVDTRWRKQRCSITALLLLALTVSTAHSQESGAPPHPAKLVNISTRGYVGSSLEALIAGFIVRGEPKEVLIRGLGPSLPFARTLGDPYLALYDGPGPALGYNDDWHDTQDAEISRTGLAPTHPDESASLYEYPDFSYTAVLYSEGRDKGTGLLELYDLDTAADSRLVNLSTRGLVQTGENVLIGGFIIRGSGTLRVLIRAIGPSMADRVDGTLADPVVKLYDEHGTMLAENDNWRSHQEAEIRATTIPPSEDAESAILRDLPAAPYTAIVSGVNGTQGLALVEIYDLN
jgi:hypothetical protein